MPNYWGLSMHHASSIRSFVNSYYETLKKFYAVPEMLNILQETQNSSNNVLLLANNTPSFTTIKTEGDKELKPIFDDKTSKLLFEHYLLLVFLDYINLSDMDEMVVTSVRRQIDVTDIFSIQYLEDNERKIKR